MKPSAQSQDNSVWAKVHRILDRIQAMQRKDDPSPAVFLTYRDGRFGVINIGSAAATSITVHDLNKNSRTLHFSSPIVLESNRHLDVDVSLGIVRFGQQDTAITPFSVERDHRSLFEWILLDSTELSWSWIFEGSVTIDLSDFNGATFVSTSLISYDMIKKRVVIKCGSVKRGSSR